MCEGACVRQQQRYCVVERKRADEIKDEPRTQIVARDLVRIENYLVRLVFSHDACQPHNKLARYLTSVLDLRYVYYCV